MWTPLDFLTTRLIDLFKQQVNLHDFGFGIGMLKLSVLALAQTNQKFGAFGSNLGFGRSQTDLRAPLEQGKNLGSYGVSVIN
jgi:hypothetical protein